MSNSPLQIVKQRHGDKATLIQAILPNLEAEPGETPEEHARRLKNVSNAKLLRLANLAEKVKALGGKDAMVLRVLELKKQPKDHEYGDKLKRMSLGRLTDLLQSLERAARRAAAS